MAAEAKTKPTKVSVSAFLKQATDGERLADSQALVTIMEKATSAKGVMWGPNIVGFGTYAIKYADGRTSDWPVAAFSPRKPAFVIYGLRGAPNFAALSKKLGKHKQAGGCTHIKSLADVDVKVLAQLVNESVKARKAKK